MGKSTYKKKSGATVKKMVFGLGSVWGRFGVGPGSVWGRFGLVLGSFWNRFGIVLG